MGFAHANHEFRPHYCDDGTREMVCWLHKGDINLEKKSPGVPEQDGKDLRDALCYSIAAADSWASNYGGTFGNWWAALTSAQKAGLRESALYGRD